MQRAYNFSICRSHRPTSHSGGGSLSHQTGTIGKRQTFASGLGLDKDATSLWTTRAMASSTIVDLDGVKSEELIVEQICFPRVSFCPGWRCMKLSLMSLPSGHFMFRWYWKERMAGDQGRLRPESAAISAGMWHWLGFVLEAHGCLWFHKPRLPLMPRLEAVTAPGLGPVGFCELLMSQGSEDSANLSHSRFSCSPQCPGLLGDLSGRMADR